MPRANSKVRKVRKVSQVSTKGKSVKSVIASPAKSARKSINSSSTSVSNSTKTVNTVVARKKQKFTKIQKSPKLTSKLTADIFDIAGRKKGTQTLPKEYFGARINKKLLSQALHIYFTNQSTNNASTKTRSEVRGGGAKPWRQKGTGRARAGSNRSPIWVGGGIAHGPKPRIVKLSLPKKMKHKALISALSASAKENKIKIIFNMENIEPKTKIIANFLKKLDTKGPSLFITSQKNQNIKLASRNIPDTFIDIASNLNAFEIVKNSNIIFTKEALEKLSLNLSNNK